MFNCISKDKTIKILSSNLHHKFCMLLCLSLINSRLLKKWSVVKKKNNNKGYFFTCSKTLSVIFPNPQKWFIFLRELGHVLMY